MHHFRYFTILGIILSSFSVVLASDQIYPSGVGIQSDYSVNPVSPVAGETFTIIRTLTNNESFGFTSLYFSENLPSGFELDSVHVQINGTDFSSTQYGPFANQISTGYDCYRWVIGGVAAGDVVELTLYVTSVNPADYMLPFHTAVMYGNGAGLFATSAPTNLTIQSPPDIIPPAQIVDVRESL